MLLILTRKNYTPWGVEGTLEIADQRVCHTVEHPDGYLTEGFYKVKLLHDKRSGRKVPALAGDDLPMVRRTRCPRLRLGNGPFTSREGSITVGKRLMAGVVNQSAEIYGRLIDRLEKAEKRQEPVKLLIKDY